MNSKRSEDYIPAEYFRKIIEPTIPKLPPNHPRRLYHRDFYGMWYPNDGNGKPLHPDDFADLCMQFQQQLHSDG